MVLSNENSGSSNCNAAVFMDGAGALLNGRRYPPAPPAAGRRLARRLASYDPTSPPSEIADPPAVFPPDTSTGVVATIDAAGFPSLSDKLGNPFVLIPFPAGGAPSACAPLRFAAATPVAVNVGTAAFPRVPSPRGVTFISVDITLLNQVGR